MTNILAFINKPTSELEKLSTRHLFAIFRSSYRMHYTCGCIYNCGDEVLPADQRAVNQAIRSLHTQVKTLLDAREHIPTSAQSKQRTIRPGRPEKKRMVY